MSVVQHTTKAPASIDLRTQSPARDEYTMMARLRMARILRSRTEEPELDPAALHGLAGDIVRAIAPTTEASAPPMLVTLLTAAGAMIGRGAFTLVGPEPHYPALFSVVVGETGTGKGVSLAAVRPVLTASDDGPPPFLKNRVRKGFQSGEAVIQMAADLSGGTPSSPVPDTGQLRPDQRRA